MLRELKLIKIKLDQQQEILDALLNHPGQQRESAKYSFDFPLESEEELKDFETKVSEDTEAFEAAVKLFRHRL